MKKIELTSFEKEYRLVRDTFLSPYEINQDFFLSDEEKLETNLGTGPQCLR